MRKPSDYILSLRQKGLCPGVILPYSGKKEEEIDVVVHGKAMKTRMESYRYPLEKVYFRQYLPGHPNHLTVPINLTHV